LTSDTSYSYSPTVASDGPKVHVVWRGGRDGNDEIYYKRSTDSGETWEPETRLTVNTSQSRRPSVAPGGGAVHVVWTESRDGNPEVYYKRDPSGSVGLAEPRSPAPGRGRTAAAVVRDVLRMNGLEANSGWRAGLLDISGREVLELHAGDNDVRRLAPGVYFVVHAGLRLQSGNGSNAKVIVTR